MPISRQVQRTLRTLIEEARPRMRRGGVIYWLPDRIVSSFRGSRSENPATVLAVKLLGCIADVIFDERISGNEQLSGDGNESELGGLSLASQVEIGALHFGIVAAGDEGGHVEGGSYARSAAGNSRARRSIAGLTDMRGQAGEASNGSAIGAADLGQFSDESRCHPFANAGNRGEYLKDRRKLRIPGNASGQFGFDAPALCGESGNCDAVAIQQKRLGSLFKPRLLHGDHLGELAAARG